MMMVFFEWILLFDGGIVLCVLVMDVVGVMIVVDCV